jgi:hypothetical protein
VTHVGRGNYTNVQFPSGNVHGFVLKLEAKYITIGVWAHKNNAWFLMVSGMGENNYKECY